MFRKLIKNKKAQQTAEYALLISLVVAAIIAMQTFAQRTIQARIRDASGYLAKQTSAMGQTNQYEPYYLKSQYEIFRDDSTTEVLGNAGAFRMDLVSNRTRWNGGFESKSYDTTLGVINGL